VFIRPERSDERLLQGAQSKGGFYKNFASSYGVRFDCDADERCSFA